MRRVVLSDVHLLPDWRPHPGRGPLRATLRMLGSSPPGELWILGDLFDFWFEYRSVQPAGFERELGLLAALDVSGWDIHFVPGNHDFWVGRHFAACTGATVHDERVVETDDGVVMVHGDGIGRGDIGYRYLLRPLLRGSATRFLFGLLHPDLASMLARAASGTSRDLLRKQVRSVPGGLREWARGRLEGGASVVVAGHTHVPLVERMAGGWFVSLGGWLSDPSYCVLEEGGVPPTMHSPPGAADEDGDSRRDGVSDGA